MKKILEIVIKTILITIIFICLISFSLLKILSTTVLNQNYILQKLDETNYYANIYTQVKSDFRNYIYQSGLNEEVIEDIITPEEVEQDTKSMIDGIYNGNEVEINTTKISKRLNKNIDKSLEDLDLTTETQKAIDEFVVQITKQYEETINKTLYKNKYYTYYTKINKLSNLATKATLIATIISTILVLLINFKKIFKNFAIIGIPFLSAGISDLIIYKYITKKVYIDYLTVLNDAVTISLREIIKSVVENITTYAYTYIIIGTILIIIGNILNSIQEKNSESKTIK